MNFEMRADPLAEQGGGHIPPMLDYSIPQNEPLQESYCIKIAFVQQRMA